MNKRIYFCTTVLLVLILILVLLVACNPTEKADSNNSTGTIDPEIPDSDDDIFTENATYDEILSAMEKAESLTVAYEISSVKTDYAGKKELRTRRVHHKIAGDVVIMTNTYTSQINDTVNYACNTDYHYRSAGVDYSAYTFIDASEKLYISYINKNLAEIYLDYYADAICNLGVEIFSEYTTTDADGDIIVKTVDMENYVDGTAYVKLNGNSIEIGFELKYFDEYGESVENARFTWSGLNNTTVDIPDDVKAMEASAKWSQYVNHNGVSYRKDTDADGNEYYYVDNIEPGSVPEKTINTLPVKDKFVPMPESWRESVSVMNKELSQKLKDNQQFNADDGRKFVADFELELAIDDKTEANADASYKFIARANINVDSFDTQIYLAITEEKEGYTTPKTLFGIGYEDSKTNPYLYFNINNGGYKKINGFSIGQLILDLAAKDSGAVAAEDGGFDIKFIIDQIMADPTSIFDLLSTMEFIKTNGTRANYGNRFIYEFNLPAIINAVSSVVNDKLITDNLGQEGLTQIMGVIKKIPVFANCSSIADVWKSIGEYIQFTKLSYRIDFAENSNEIIGMGFTVNFVENNDSIPNPIGVYTLSLNKIRVDMGAPIADIFAGTGIDEVADETPIGILNFHFDTFVNAKNAEGVVVNKYKVTFDVDIDPFQLMELVGKVKGEGADQHIADALAKLGCFNITVDKYNADGTSLVENVVTIKSVNNAESGLIEKVVVYAANAGSPEGGSEYTVMQIIEAVKNAFAPKSTEAAAAADGLSAKIVAVINQVISLIQKIDTGNKLGAVVDFINTKIIPILTDKCVQIDQIVGAISFNKNAEGKIDGLTLKVADIINTIKAIDANDGNDKYYDALIASFDGATDFVIGSGEALNFVYGGCQRAAQA